jgi:hypothetical protein
MPQDSWLQKLSSIQASLKKEMKMEVCQYSATNQFKIVMLILEKIFIKMLFFPEELLSTKDFQIDFNRSSMQYAHKQTWLKLLLLQIDITQYGLVAQLFVLSQLSKVNGLLRRNTKKTELKSFIENACEASDF